MPPRAAAAWSFLAGPLAVMASCPPSPPPCPPCVPAQSPPSVAVRLVNMVPESLSGETNQDSEPFLAVDGTDPTKMAASAFTPNPFGTASGLAPVYVSTDGGNSWTLNLIVPSAGQIGTGDITLATSGAPSRLYGGILRIPGDLLLNTLRSDDLTEPTPMRTLEAREQVDQPFVQSSRAGNEDRVYVGNNDFAAAGGRTATVDLSIGSATFRSIRLETRATSGQNGPSVRPAIARDGTVYAAYFGWRRFDGSFATSDVVVVRDDTWGSGAAPFTALRDPRDGDVGARVVEGVTIPWSGGSALGFERIGSSLSIAVDPENSSTVYVAWADRVGANDIYTIHVRRSTDRGLTWSGDLTTVTNGTCFSLAVAEGGVLGFLYQQLVGQGGCSCWVTHLVETRDGFASREDLVLSVAPAQGPEPQFLPYLGDYNFLLAMGGTFHGIFSANNTPDSANFPAGVRYQRRADFGQKRLLDGAGNPVAVSIDPFYFGVEAIR